MPPETEQALHFSGIGKGLERMGLGMGRKNKRFDDFNCIMIPWEDVWVYRKPDGKPDGKPDRIGIGT